jgi:hypothetical protein
MGLKVKDPNGEWKKTGGALKVIKVDEGGASVVPLTVTENGVYDTPYYETATEVWDSNTEYAGSVTVDGVTLSFKKAENLIVPDDLNELEADKYTGTCEFIVDGETEVREELLSDNLEITQGVCATYQGYAVIWVKQAAPLNAQFGISFLEDNTVYITNLTQMVLSQEYGASYVKTVCKAPSKKIDNVAYCPVNVELPLADREITPTRYGTELNSKWSNTYYKRVLINPVPTQTLEVTPLMEDTTYEPEEGKFFSTVTVKGVDASDPSTLHQLCGIYFKVLPKTEYKIGEWPDPSNAILVVQYTDGTTKEIVDSSQGGEATINDFIYDFTTASVGTFPITVKYTENGITSQSMFWITVTE